MLESLEVWADIVAGFVVPIGAALALLTYWRDAKLRRAEWLYRLYQQFYENDRFNPIRALVDYTPDAKITQLKADIDGEVGSSLHEAFVDYLNFFEFIAIQLKNKTLRRAEVLDMFEYYIKRLGDLEFVVKYIEDYGYENLDALLKSFPRNENDKN